MRLAFQADLVLQAAELTMLGIKLGSEPVTALLRDIEVRPHSLKVVVKLRMMLNIMLPL